ncbi:PcfJ domain-containing protein [Agrobacterium salinitolerans]|nr:PcfJ domain-containing protein [Agrobacterium salinitolerans]
MRVFELLRTQPDLAEWIASGRHLAFELVELLDKAIDERCADIPISELTPERLRCVANEVFQTVPSMRQNPTQGFIECAYYLGKRYYGLLWTIEAGKDEAAAFLRTGSVDWDRLQEIEQAVIENDPRHIASRIIIRLMRGGDWETHRLLEKSLGKIIEKEVRRNSSWQAMQEEQSFHHVRDWIGSAVANRAAWLTNLDDNGCPKKLAKCGSLSALVAEADKQMKKDLNSQGRSAPRNADVFASDGGAYHIVNLATPQAIDRESNEMRHCIGHGSYDRFLGLDGHLFLSLRDEFGRPHATMEVVKGKIVQFYGKANSVPKEEYREATLQLLSPRGIELPDSSNLDSFQVDDWFSHYWGAVDDLDYEEMPADAENPVIQIDVQASNTAIADVDEDFDNIDWGELFDAMRPRPMGY